MSKKAACRYEHLDKKLRKSFTCSTKHNIYKNCMHIGDHFVECGDFTKATTCYVKAKDYVDQFSQFVSWHIKIIKVHTNTYFDKNKNKIFRLQINLRFLFFLIL